MIIEEIMKTEVACLTPTDTIATAIELMNSKRIRHVPIINEDNKLVGIISDRDVRDASPSIFHTNEFADDLQQPLQSLMTTDVITGSPLDFVEEVAALFYEHRISCLPIVKDGMVVGIVTETDMLHTLVQLTGAHQPSSHIEVKVKNKAGMLCEVATVFRDLNTNISSVLVYPDKDERYKILVFRVQTINPLKIIAGLKQEGYTVLWPSVPESYHE
ncbi:CBS domain-containing protein [Bacillus sp. HMF5848]|uniref:acetoin utilization AcuB family protein n=1 Tax=Bacillus sp. HMF5848 TaxID=2495421 RepID=UPI000F79693C|nr:acetoin utilization AcuB family protein [Bacillus sp. HMF5848]RSK28195.1 CBS domain-containing protein [Bacillus sp. HMF5848]